MIVTASVASFWFVVVALVLIMGIEITSKVQLVMTGIELIILTVLADRGVRACRAGRRGECRFPGPGSGSGYTRQSFAASALVAVFFYWGWDVTANLGEETGIAEDTAGNGGFSSVDRHHLLLSGLHHRGAVPVLAQGRQKPLTDNIVYNLAVASGLGRARRAGGIAGGDPVVHRHT